MRKQIEPASCEAGSICLCAEIWASAYGRVNFRRSLSAILERRTVLSSAHCFWITENRLSSTSRSAELSSFCTTYGVWEIIIGDIDLNFRHFGENYCVFSQKR